MNVLRDRMRTMHLAFQMDVARGATTGRQSLTIRDESVALDRSIAFEKALHLDPREVQALQAKVANLDDSAFVALFGPVHETASRRHEAVIDGPGHRDFFTEGLVRATTTAVGGGAIAVLSQGPSVLAGIMAASVAIGKAVVGWEQTEGSKAQRLLGALGSVVDAQYIGALLDHLWNGGARVRAADERIEHAGRDLDAQLGVLGGKLQAMGKEAAQPKPESKAMFGQNTIPMLPASLTAAVASLNQYLDGQEPTGP